MMAYQKVYMNQIHSSSLLSQLAEMWRRDVLCDAVITTGTVDTKAHRLVLVAACPMLQSMDSASIGNKLEVKLSADIRKEAVMSFLQYLYDGFMTLTEDNVRDVEKIARLLQVDSVTKCCNNFYKDLHEKVGQVVASNAMYCLNADSLDLKHIRTSDLQRLMQSCEKRVINTEEVSARKKAKVQQYTAAQAQKSTGEDSFHLIQSQHKDYRKISQDEPVLQHSLALSVAGREENTGSENQVIIADDMDSTSSAEQSLSQTDTSLQRISATSNASLNSSENIINSVNFKKKTSQSRSGDRPFSPSTNISSAFKDKVTNLPLPKEHSCKQMKSNSLSHTETHQEKQVPIHGHFTSNTVENDIIIEQMTEEYDRMDTMRQGTSISSSVKNSASHSEKKRVTRDSGDCSENDFEARYSPDQSRVKVEPGSFNGSYGVMLGSQDEGHSVLKASEMETNDTEDVDQADTSQSSFIAEEPGSAWYTQTFKEFLIQNNESPDFEMLTLEEVDGALCRFYRSTIISPERLRNFPRQISDHLRSQPYSRNVDIETDWRFEASNNAINAGLAKHFQDEGRRKKAMKQEDLNKLYESGVLSNENPVSLQNKVWVELMINIGGLARTELRRLEKDNFVFEKDTDGRLYYRLEAQCMTEAKKQVRVYEQPDNLNCPLRSICLYLSKLHPKSEVFFQQPMKPFSKFSDRAIWYTHKPIGKNIHSMWLATICKEAGITTDYSNHALYCRSPHY